MRKWTAEERARQAELIRGWQPWKTAGVKTPEGKAISSRNAYKHGCYGTETRKMRRILKSSLDTLRMLEIVLAERKRDRADACAADAAFDKKGALSAEKSRNELI